MHIMMYQYHAITIYVELCRHCDVCHNCNQHNVLVNKVSLPIYLCTANCDEWQSFWYCVDSCWHANYHKQLLGHSFFLKIYIYIYVILLVVRNLLLLYSLSHLQANTICHFKVHLYIKQCSWSYSSTMKMQMHTFCVHKKLCVVWFCPVQLQSIVVWVPTPFYVHFPLISLCTCSFCICVYGIQLFQEMTIVFTQWRSRRVMWSDQWLTPSPVFFCLATPTPHPTLFSFFIYLTILFIFVSFSSDLYLFSLFRVVVLEDAAFPQ